MRGRLASPPARFAAFAWATVGLFRRDLRFKVTNKDHGSATQRFPSPPGLRSGGGHQATRDGNPVAGKELLGLVLVKLHRRCFPCLAGLLKLPAFGRG